MEYFGYKPKDLDKSYIDWSGITKGISDEITSTLVNRQQQRDQLEKDHFERLKKLNEFNLSVDPSASSSVLKGVQNARDYLMSNQRLMKSGAISVDEAKRRAQNVMDSWTFLSKGMETYVAGAEKRAESEGKLNDAYNEIIPGYFDLANSGQVPEPGSGEGYTVPYNPDGTLNMDRAIPNRAMLNLGSQVAEFVDVEAATTAIANDAKTGVWKQTFANGTSIADARQNPNYKSWIENTISSNLNTDEKLASVLLDYKGMEYTTTNEPGKIQVEFDKKTGKLKPVLTDKQRDDARHEFRHSIEAKIGAVRVEEKEQKPTESERAELGLVKSLDRFLSSGDKTDLDAVFSAVGVNDYQFTDNELRLNVRDKQGNLTSRTIIPINEGMSNLQLGNAIAGKIGITNYKDKTTLSTEQQSGINYDTSKLSGIISENTAAQKLGKVSARSDGELLKAFKDDGYGNAPTPEGIASAARLVGLDLGIPTENIKILDDGVSLEVNGVNLGDPTLLDAATVKSKMISTISTQGGSGDDFINLTKNAINSNK